MANIIIFGGQGYIGQNILKKSITKHNFLTLGRSEEKLFSELNYIHLSIYDSELLKKLNLFKPDYYIVSYYGNPSNKDISVYRKLDEIIESIYINLVNKPKLVFISSQLAYGIRLINNYNKTSNEIIDFYAKMCVEFERKIIDIANNNYLILRVPIVYGGEHNKSKGYANIVSAFLDAASKGQKLKIYGSGSQIRSFIHIDDFVELIDIIINQGININLLNTCFNEHYSIRQLADLIALKFNTLCENVDWPNTEISHDNYDIILDSSIAMSMVKNKWNMIKFLNSEYD